MTRGQAILVAALVAPALPAAAMSVGLVFSYRNGPWALISFPLWYVIALLAEVLLGGPLLLIAWRLRLVTWWTSAIAGGLVGIGALLIVTAFRLSILHGTPVVAGLGVAAGLVFWLVARRGEASPSGGRG